ncbi:MAG TPA: PKD domain-containing protein [Bacteroidia bacterium]|nr:PKD domain-containing protein [Bacteroidia bacterium]
MRSSSIYRIILLFFVSWCTYATPVKAQDILISPDYLFYGGDTLNDFNFKAALDFPEVQALDKQDLLAYLLRQEKAFVIKKYNIALPVPHLNHSTNKSHSVTATSPCNNADFEDGNYTNWTGNVGCNQNSNAALTITSAGINTLGTNSGETTCSWHTIVTTGADPYGGFPMLDPAGGAYSCRIGGSKANLSKGSGGCGTNAMDPSGAFGENLEQTFPVTTANSMFVFDYAVVLNDGGHPNGEEPYFSAQVFDQSNNLIACLSFSQQCTSGSPPPGFSTSGSTGSGGSAVYYLPWTAHTFDLKPYIGTNVTIVFTAAGCTLGGHFGYAYVDCTCGQVWPLVIPTCNSDTITAPPGGLTYSWTGPGIVSGAGSQSTVVNASGTYTVVVTTSTTPLCTYTLDTAVVVPGPIVITITPTNELCNGGNTGSASSNVTGGTPGYTYSWSNGQTGSNATALTAGSYTLTVTDSHGCKGTGTVTITQPSAVTTAPSSVASICTANNGTATITAGGGTPGYTYLWNGGQTTSSISPVSAGTYTVTVKDANGCTITANVTVPNTVSTLTATTTPTNPLCNGGTGSATVTGPGGGTAPYTYVWSNAQTGTTATALTIGTYTVTITDANGCTGTETVTITQPTAITTTTSSTPTNCSANTGTASVTASNGTPGYTYLWSNGLTSSNISNLSAGSYTVTVTDANSCTTTATVVVASSGATITPTLTSTNVLCNGGNTGTATVTGVTGGTTPYTYSWSSGQITTNITGLTAGTYTITVTDANGCTGTASVTVSQPTVVTASASNTAALCNGGNGTATVTAGGGTPGYTYSWSSGPTTSTMTASAGTYTATVTDANGCTVTATTTITQPTAMTTTTSFVGAICGMSNGSASITNVTGGTPGYTYLWSTGAVTTTISAISAGAYNVTVTDANGCTTIATVNVPNSGGPRDSIVSTVNILCYNGNNGSITLGVANGTLPYTFAWSSGQVTQNITGLTAGTYSVTVTDANGCIVTANAIITQPSQLRDSIVSIKNEPCFGNSLGNITTGEKGGTLPYSYSWSSGQVSQNLTNISAGTYTITVTDANGCVVTADTTITQPTALTITAAGFPASCFGSCDGQVAVIPSGGTTPYTYLWTPSGSTNASQPGMCAGTDSVYVTDANGCKVDSAVIVTQPAAIDDSIVGTVNVLCNGGNNGSATVGVKGGTSPYTYSWTSAAGTNATATGLTAGSYTCTVTDKDLCSNTVVATITEPPVLVATLPAPSTLCIGQSVTITATVIGGTPTYTYSWSNGATTSSITVSPVVTTSYSVTVTDANGCIVGPISITITVNPPLAVIAGPTKSICPGGTTTISATASGGDGTYTYVWTPGGMNGSSVNVSPGTTTTYTVTVNDGCGTPAVTATEAVIVDPLPVVSFTADTTNGCYPLCINFKDMTTIASGGVNQWQWTFGNGGTSSHADTTYCYMNPGQYTVGLTVTSDSGCSSSQTVPNMITVYNHPTAMFTSSPQPATIIEPTVNFTDESTDDYGIVKWQWLFGDPLDGNSQLQNPSYTYADTGTYCPNLKVTNKYGCVDSITQCIVIEPFFTLYIPNAFSPNGDGVNDIFTAKGDYVCGFQMYIFDRWGMQLFYTEDMQKGWNGTVNGGQNVEQEDTYVYLIYAVDCIEHKKHSYIGKVNIVN